MATKQLEVQIMGQSYLLGCPEGGESRLLEAVEKVDTAMCKIRDAGKVKARDRIAVLAALNLAFDVAERSAAPAFQPSGFANSSFRQAVRRRRQPRPERGRLADRWCSGWTARWARTAGCSDSTRRATAFCAACSLWPCRRPMESLQSIGSAVHAGLYISLNQCS
jgi:cell division protein ZapA